MDGEKQRTNTWLNLVFISLYVFNDDMGRQKRDVSLSGTFEVGGRRMDELLLATILSKLPIESILRFKRVCKSWYALIKSRHFISNHLKHYYDKMNNNRCLILQYVVNTTDELNACKLMTDDDKSMQVISSEFIETLQNNTYICGPCDGIYLLSRVDSEAHHSLWNPALNELVQLPKMISKPGLPSYMKPSTTKAYGFGFDSKTKDYKVIVIESYENKCPLSVFIYSLKFNSWRYWGDLKNSYYLLLNSSYAFVNGCYYWLGSRKPYYDHGFHRWGEDPKAYPEVAISFDITVDAYKEIPLPKLKKKPQHYGSQLVVYHDSIAFVYVPPDDAYFSVWTWNERVWTQKFKGGRGFRVEGAINHWRDNVFVIRISGGMLVWFDTDTEEMGFLDHPSPGRRFGNIVIYRESLVLIKEFIRETLPFEIHGDAEDTEIPYTCSDSYE